MISWEDAFVKYSDTKIAKSMNLKQWLNMWGRLCYGSAGISDFPIWVQILPDIFFKVIDRDEDGLLAYEEVKNFYKGCLGIDASKLEKTCKEGYRAMTAVIYIVFLSNKKYKYFATRNQTIHIISLATFTFLEWRLSSHQDKLRLRFCQLPPRKGYLRPRKIHIWSI